MKIMLTRNAVKDIMCEKNLLNPTVQISDIRRKRRNACFIPISDGKSIYEYTMIDDSSMPMIENLKLSKYSIIKLTRYEVRRNSFRGSKKIVIQELVIKVRGETIGKLIGEPVSYFLPQTLLSEGVLLDIMSGICIQKPWVQILLIQKYRIREGGIYRLVVSDGLVTCETLLNPIELSCRIDIKELKEFAFIQLTRYDTIRSARRRNERLIIIKDIEMRPEHKNPGKKIGNPENFLFLKNLQPQ